MVEHGKDNREKKLKKIRKANCIYDIKYMKEILGNSRPIILFTVLQKFRKVLDMQILKDYLYTTKKQPIVYLSLKEVKGKTYEEMLENMKLAILKCNKEHLYLFQNDRMSDFEKSLYKNILYKDSNIVTLKTSITFLTKLLYEYHNKYVIILLDEYDASLYDAYVNGYYDEAESFFTRFYINLFKDNPNFEKAIVTGTREVDKERQRGVDMFELYEMKDKHQTYRKIGGYTPWQVLNYYQ